MFEKFMESIFFPALPLVCCTNISPFSHKMLSLSYKNVAFNLGLIVVIYARHASLE